MIITPAMVWMTVNLLLAYIAYSYMLEEGFTNHWTSWVALVIFMITLFTAMILFLLIMGGAL